MGREKSIPRAEYPRPQFVRKEWLNLNGSWDVEIGKMDTTPPTVFSRKILVPFCPESKLSGIAKKEFIPWIWYRRNFELPKQWFGKRILLHFGAVDYEATVWVNGNKIGSHRGGYTPFSFEITRYITNGNNELIVCAKDDTRNPLQPSGKQSDKLESYGCFYTRTTGIWQTVWLEPVPQTYLRSFKIYPNIKKGSITVRATVDGKTSGLNLTTTAFAKNRKVGEVTVPTKKILKFHLHLSEKKLWEPNNPFLYALEFKLVKEKRKEKVIDTVKSYFGLREIRISRKKVLINNKPIFQRLVLDQGYYPDGIYTAPNDTALKRDIELSLKLGFNGARLHQKVFEPRFLYWADKLGYLVWGEYPNWGLDHSHPEAIVRVQAEWREVIERDFNHPCIVGWCPFNETPRQQNPELLRIIYRLTKQLDPTRPVIDTSGYVHVETDVYDVHNYEQDPDKFKALFEPFKKLDKNVWRNVPEQEVAYQGQPYFVSEYGGIWWNPEQKDKKSWGYGERPRTAEEFIARYRGLTESLLFHPKMFGFCYTQLYDIEQEVNGLYTYDRKPKFHPNTIRRINIQRAAIEKT
ncbi:MAG: beta-galactosidase [bacterium]|nr:beta-galactosidase [bacterium]